MTVARDGMARAAGALFLLHGLSYGAALVKQVVIARAFGTGAAMDAYLVALTVVGLLLAWVLTPIRQVVLPMFRHDVGAAGEGYAWRNFGVLLANVTVGLAILAGVVAVTAPWLVALLAPGFDAATAAIATSLTRITMPAVVLVGVAVLLSQAYFARGRVVLPGVIGLADHAVTLGVFVLFLAGWGIEGLAMAVVLGGAAQFVVQLPVLWRIRSSLTVRVDPRHAASREATRLGTPLLLSTAGTEVARITDRIFASLLPAGSLSALAYAGRLTTVLHDAVTGSLQQSTFPHFTRLAAERRFPELSRQLFHYARVVLAVTVPLAVVLAVVAESLVRLVFEHGAFDERSVSLTAQPLAVYALALPAQALANVLNRTFYGVKDTRTPTRLSLARIALKIVLSAVLVHRFAHVGLALAESISHVVRTIVLVVALPREIAGTARRTLLAGAVKSAGAALAMAALVMAVGAEGVPALFGAVTVGLALYAGLTFVLQRPECRTVLGAVSALRSRRTP